MKDTENPQLLGWHKGTIKTKDIVRHRLDIGEDIVGSEISELNEKGEIVERTVSKKADYIFKNTPYSTYGAVYNNYESKLFANYEKGSAIGDGTYVSYPVGEFEKVDGYQTRRIKFNDSVKGSATYKGEVVAHVSKYTQDGKYLPEKAPKVDGLITINANFGTKAEDVYASATLDSQTLGKVEFDQKQLDIGSPYGIKYDTRGRNNSHVLDLRSIVVGKEANEIVGKISSVAYIHSNIKESDVSEYKAVFAAEKQPK